MQNNYLLNQYQNMQNNNQYQNNILLQNNPHYQNNIQQAKYVQQMQQIRKAQLMQQMQDKVKEYTKNLLEPTQVKEDNTQVKQNFIKLSKEHETTNYKIDNTPYKQIISDPKYGGEDYKKKHNKDTFDEDVCVHKVTNKDKEGVDEEFDELEKKIKKHDKKLKKIYSTEKKEEHKKKFEYRKSYIYKVGNDETNSIDLKKDRLKFFEKQQKEWEKDQIKTKNIIEECREIGILNDDQINDVMKDL